MEETTTTTTSHVVNISISHILSDKIKKILIRKSFLELIIISSKVGFFIYIGLFFIYPHIVWNITKKTLLMQDFWLLKMLLIYLTFRYYKNIFSFYSRILKKYKYGHNELLCGIPKKELIDYLFIYGTFKEKEILNKFGISHDNFILLVKKLQEVAILIKGPNNSNIFNLEYSREEAYNLINVNNINEIKNKFLNFGSGIFKKGPQKNKQIEERFTHSPIDHYLTT